MLAFRIPKSLTSSDIPPLLRSGKNETVGEESVITASRTLFGVWESPSPHPVFCWREGTRYRMVEFRVFSSKMNSPYSKWVQAILCHPASWSRGPGCHPMMPPSSLTTMIYQEREYRIQPTLPSSFEVFSFKGCSTSSYIEQWSYLLLFIFLGIIYIQ